VGILGPQGCVAQFRQAHYLQPGARQVLESHLPEAAASLREVDACAFSALRVLPPSIADRARGLAMTV
jgi:hypothetical protein